MCSTSDACGKVGSPVGVRFPSTVAAKGSSLGSWRGFMLELLSIFIVYKKLSIFTENGINDKVIGAKYLRSVCSYFIIQIFHEPQKMFISICLKEHERARERQS